MEMKTSFPSLAVRLELRLLLTPSIGHETGVVGRWWSRRLPRTQRVFGCEFQPTPHGESREELHLPAGAVRSQDGEASGLDTEVLHWGHELSKTKPHDLSSFH